MNSRIVLYSMVMCAGSILLAQRPSRAEPFDYYLLSLSWAPEFCAESGKAAANPQECGVGKHIGFVVHGLWPEVEQGNGPENCASAKPVSRGIVNSLLPSMMSAGLVQHEWATHGVCSGLSQNAYFTNVLLARAAVQIPVQLSSLTEDEKQSPAQVAGLFLSSNPQFVKAGVRTACKGGALAEVRVCFDKDLKSRACTASAGECKDPLITVRAPR